MRSPSTPDGGRRYRILLCHNAYKEAGGESSVFDTEVEGLRRAGHAVSTYTRSNHEIDQMGAFGRLATVPRAFRAGRTEQDIADLVARERPEVAVVQNVFPLISPSIYRALRANRVPVIQAVYNYRLVCADAHLYSHGEICERCIGGNHLHAVVRRCVRSSAALSLWYAAILWTHQQLGTFVDCIDRFMVPDRFLGEKLVEGGLARDRMRVNANPLFIDQYQPTTTHRGYVLFIGRLIEQKGVLSLIEAMGHTRGDLRLHVVGQGPLEERVRARCLADDAGGKVDFLGALWGQQAQDELSGAAAVVVPSEWYDNLPQILCQANALGKPVIASRINGIPEYVRDGDNGLLFTPGDRVGLAQAIDRVGAMSPVEFADFSRRARRVAERDFDYPTHHAKLMSIVAELVPAEGSHAA